MLCMLKSVKKTWFDTKAKGLKFSNPFAINLNIWLEPEINPKTKH